MYLSDIGSSNLPGAVDVAAEAAAAQSVAAASDPMPAIDVLMDGLIKLMWRQNGQDHKSLAYCL